MSDSPAVELKDVCLAFQGMTVLDHVNLTLGESEFMGLIGPNGGGKTVLLRVILGLLKPDSGSVRIFGRPPEHARGLTAYVPQYAHFDRTFPISVLDVVMMGRLHERRLFRPYSATDREHALRALQRVRMDDLAQRQIGKLSGGQLQRVLIARALAVEPRILLLDEPTANLDTAITNELYELLDELSGRMAVVLVSHDIGVISSRVKTVGCMNRRLHYHHAREITREMIEESYGCPVDFIVHEHTHRVLESHSHSPGGPPHSH